MLFVGGLKFDRLLFFGGLLKVRVILGVEKMNIIFWFNKKFALFFGVTEKINYRINSY